MGNKQSSSSSSSVKDTIINNNTINSLNKSIFDASMETLVKNASTCSSAVNQNNTCKFSNLYSGGDVTIGGNQSNTAKVDFSCVQASKVQSEMANAMVQKVLSELKSASGTEAAAQLNNAASGSQSTGAFSTAIANSSSSSTKQNVDRTIQNDTIANIESIFEQKINNSFTSDTVNECIGKTTQSNTLEADNIHTTGSITADCVQTNSLEQVQECKQLMDSISGATNQALQELGISVAAETEVTAAIEATAESVNTQTQTGGFQDIFNGISSVVGAASMNPFSIICICIVCIIISVAVMMMGGGGAMGGGGGGFLEENSSLSNTFSDDIFKSIETSATFNSDYIFNTYK